MEIDKENQMDSENMRFACEELMTALCRLVDSGRSIDKDRFHDLCGKEGFIEHLFLDHGDFVQLEFLDKNSTICKPENLEYINNALDRYANATVMEDFGLRNNAYMLAINFTARMMWEIAEKR